MKRAVLASAFDPLHVGHLWAIQQALSSGQCETVVALVHADPSLERPEKRKPALTIAERMMALEACRYVERVVPYRTEQDLREIYQILKPAMIIVGEDHRGDPVTGQGIAPIFWARRRPEWSSTEIIRRLAGSLKES